MCRVERPVYRDSSNIRALGRTYNILPQSYICLKELGHNEERYIDCGHEYNGALRRESLVLYPLTYSTGHRRFEEPR